MTVRDRAVVVQQRRDEVADLQRRLGGEAGR